MAQSTRVDSETKGIRYKLNADRIVVKEKILGSTVTVRRRRNARDRQRKSSN